ncbi:MAG: hypothetical protein GTN78_18320, partial [Gemmatimonadales bacterium]|nr:hypothetical protein [Gemmatimonadales bacterium]
EFARLHQQGLNAYEDYVAWGAVEREPGKWDWSRHIAMADAQRAGGMEYDPYLWIHNPPKWMRSWNAGMGGRGDAGTESLIANDPDAPDHYTLLRCVEHDKP